MLETRLLKILRQTLGMSNVDRAGVAGLYCRIWQRLISPLNYRCDLHTLFLDHLPMQSKAQFYEHFEDWATHSHCMRVECTRLLTGDFRLEITW